MINRSKIEHNRYISNHKLAHGINITLQIPVYSSASSGLSSQSRQCFTRKDTPSKLVDGFCRFVVDLLFIATPVLTYSRGPRYRLGGLSLRCVEVIRPKRHGLSFRNGLTVMSFLKVIFGGHIFQKVICEGDSFWRFGNCIPERSRFAFVDCDCPHNLLTVGCNCHSLWLHVSLHSSIRLNLLMASCETSYCY